MKKIFAYCSIFIFAISCEKEAIPNYECYTESYRCGDMEAYPEKEDIVERVMTDSEAEAIPTDFSGRFREWRVYNRDRSDYLYYSCWDSVRYVCTPL